MYHCEHKSDYIKYKKLDMGKKKDKKPDYKARLFSFKYLLYDLVKWWGWWQCLLWYRLNIKYDGKEAKKRIKGKAIISSNHVGYSDPFILQCAFLYRRFHFVFMDELLTNKFKAWVYKYVFLSYPIDRNKPSYATMKFLSEYVKGGNLLALFPEGHITTDGTVNSFKGGALLIAYLSDTPIVPVYHQKRTSIWRTTRLVVGKPFNAKERIGPVLNQDKLNKAAEELHAYELELEKMCLEGQKK